MIDLRSDTVTKPTPEMLRAISSAQVGDDVFSEDPTMNKFEQKMAEMFGMEAGLFVPSGTMSNQLCLYVLTEPGDEVIIDELGHVFNYESGAASHLSSVQLRPLKGKRGKLEPLLIETALRPFNDWDPHTKVIALENTTNKGGGAFYNKRELLAIKEFADKHNLTIHLDGARIWNAMAASGIEPVFFGSISDTISICFSKGLGAPVGSMMLAGTNLIKKARRIRKMWGGGMRQVGILAAAADYAVTHHYPKLIHDHEHAKKFAEAISKHPLFHIEANSVDTNIVLFDVINRNVKQVLDYFANKGVEMVQFGPDTIRATFHFQITDSDTDNVVNILNEYRTNI